VCYLNGCLFLLDARTLKYKSRLGTGAHTNESSFHFHQK